MAAVIAQGTTVIENAAREPEIVDLVDFLTAMGARISGGGTATLTVEGVEALLPPSTESSATASRRARSSLPARSTAGRSRCAASSRPIWISCSSSSRRPAASSSACRTASPSTASGPRRPVDVADAAVPGLPDRHAGAVHGADGVADGISIITENVFENRFMFADELARMGADIRIEGHHALVQGRRAALGRARSVPRPARRRRTGACRRSPPTARPRSATSTISTGATSASPRSSLRWAPTSSASVSSRRMRASTHREGDHHARPTPSRQSSRTAIRSCSSTGIESTSRASGRSAISMSRETAFWVPGHFPEYAVMPGVLIVEALAQVGRRRAAVAAREPGQARVLRRHRQGALQAPGRARRDAAARMRDHADARPHRLRRGHGDVDGELVCSGELMFAIK